MYLKEDGKTVVMYTILGNATFQKHVVKISDLEEVEEKYDFAKQFMKMDLDGVRHIPL